MGCNSGKRIDNQSNLKRFTINKISISEKPLSQFISEQKFIELETFSDALIGSIDEVLIIKNCIFILDSKVSKQVYQFDTLGNFIRNIGTTGKGPGEYLRPDDISFDSNKNQLLVLSRQERKVNYYTYEEGKYIDEKWLKFAASEIQPLDNGNYAVFNHDIYNKPDEIFGEDLNYLLLVTDDSFSKIKWKRFKSNSKEGEGKSIYRTGRYFNCNSNVYLNWRFNDTTYLLESSEIQPVVFIDFLSKSVKYNNYDESTANYIMDKVFEGSFHTMISPTLVAGRLLFLKFIANNKNNQYGEDQIFYLLASIDTDRTYYFTNFIDDVEHVQYNFPVGVYGDRFVSVVYPEEYIDGIDAEKDELYFKGTHSVIRRYNNPIICITKFNPF